MLADLVPSRNASRIRVRNIIAPVPEIVIQLIQMNWLKKVKRRMVEKEFECEVISPNQRKVEVKDVVFEPKGQSANPEE